MFTGIVQHKIKIIHIVHQGVDKVFHLEPCCSMANCQIGESIAINGACLTLMDFNKMHLAFYTSKETLSLTNLSALTVGNFVHVEQALSLNDRLNGHFVTGHIDTQAVLTQVNLIGLSKQLKFSIEKKYGEYLITKGSIALDGVSLTINDCTSTSFTVNIIPETLRRTTLSNWSLGYQPNVEIDTLSKHIYSYLHRKKNNVLDKTFLSGYGFE